MDGDRRKNPRVKPGQVVVTKIRTFMPGEVRDLSAGGLLLRVRKSLVRGTSCSLRLALPEGEVELGGTVTRCSLAGFETDEDGDRVRTYDAGIAFDRPHPELADRFGPDDSFRVQMDEG